MADASESAPNTDVLVDDDGPIRTVILNRPERMNAFSFPMRVGVEEALWDFQRNDDLRVLVLTGAGRGFCAGADLLAAADQGPKETVWEKTRDRWWYYRAFEAVEKPTICALNGSVAGGGLGLMLACDFIVANSSAKIVPGFPRVGISPDNGVGKHLPERIGYHKALLFMLRGEAITPQQALEWGMVDEVYDNEEFEDGWRRMAKQIAEVPPVTATLTKRLFRDAPSLPIHIETAYEQLLVGMAHASGEGEAAREAFRARMAADAGRQQPQQQQ